MHSSLIRAALPVVVAALVSLLTAPAALADSSGHAHTMPGMSAAEHAQMSGGAGGGHDHAQMSGGAGGGHDHAQMSGGAGGGHDHAQMSDGAGGGDHPVALVLGGFLVFNASVLAYAAFVRRRPDVRKRLDTLARVRSAPPVRTVPAGGEKP